MHFSTLRTSASGVGGLRDDDARVCSCQQLTGISKRSLGWIRAKALEQVQNKYSGMVESGTSKPAPEPIATQVLRHAFGIDVMQALVLAIDEADFGIVHASEDVSIRHARNYCPGTSHRP